MPAARRRDCRLLEPAVDGHERCFDRAEGETRGCHPVRCAHTRPAVTGFRRGVGSRAGAARRRISPASWPAMPPSSIRPTRPRWRSPLTPRPEHIWPWLVQMGYQRGGLYSYDWLDRLFGYLDRPSADSLLAQFQQLAVGDEIPIGRGQGFPVTAIEPYRALVLSGAGDGFAWVWQFGLYPVDQTRTRLVSRNRVRVPRTVGSWLFMRVIEPAAFLMTRRMLLGLKHRAEALAVAQGERSSHAA